MRQHQFVWYGRWFDEIGLDDLNLVGGKNTSLGELAQALSDRITVPEGFAITVEAYRHMVDLKGLWQKMMRILDGTNWYDPRVTAAASVKLRKRSIQPVPRSSALIRNHGTSGSRCVSVFSLIWRIETSG